MPSPEHEADLERVLARAAQECEASGGVWFGDGLPQAVRAVLEALGHQVSDEAAALAFVEVDEVSPQGQTRRHAEPVAAGCPIIGLSTATLDDLATLVGPPCDAGIQLTRLICPVAVFDFTPDGVQVREVRHGLTAADLQNQLSTPLWAAPDLKELGTH